MKPRQGLWACSPRRKRQLTEFFPQDVGPKIIFNDQMFPLVFDLNGTNRRYFMGVIRCCNILIAPELYRLGITNYWKVLAIIFLFSGKNAQ